MGACASGRTLEPLPIAWVTFALEKYPALKEYDSYRRDDEVVQQKLQSEQKIASIYVVWDDASVAWKKQFSMCVLRSCWDYHEKPALFWQFINRLELEGVVLCNPPRIVKWNMSKQYLRDLQPLGVHLPPSIFFSVSSSHSPAENESVMSCLHHENILEQKDAVLPSTTFSGHPVEHSDHHTDIKKLDAQHLLKLMQLKHWEKVIIKPYIGAGGDGVFCITAAELEQLIGSNPNNNGNPTNLQVVPENGMSSKLTLAQVNSMLERASRPPGCLIQQFRVEIAEGEWSLVFIDHRFSHAVQKIPPSGEFRASKNLHCSVQTRKPPSTMLAHAERIVALLPDLCLFARIDMMMRHPVPDSPHPHAVPLLIELELIEPYLFFEDADPRGTAASMMAKSIARRIESLSRSCAYIPEPVSHKPV